ncbi:hypothetical protein BELL_0741g00040 [Botrytis elliptica]|uniref:Uncharacterized protein n=1 Tax=Botrytis elliptica TaxID=278938 RepID=A0A4Z1J8R0_9HELO|nr:hypothetical protein BELL_0741g00040 [Botrytis elliptica]
MASMNKAQPLDETTDSKSSPGITSNIRSTDRWIYGWFTQKPIQQLLESFGPQSETQLRTATSLNGWAIMYWSLLLTPSEVKMLEENPLVYEVLQAVVAGTDDI